MLEEAKKSLRITDNDFDDEVRLLIEAAKEDLESSGVASSYFVTKDEETEEEIGKIDNKLLKLAIILYCKTFFGFDNPDSEKYNNAYEHIKKKVSITLKGE